MGPVDFERRNHGRGHSYWLDGHRLPGVTTILDEAIRKRALENWAATTTAKAAVDRWDELADLPVSARLDRLTRARWEVSDAAKLTGTKVHGYAEDLSHGRDTDVPPQYVGAAEALARFMDEYRVEPVAVERPVFHARHGWAGTPDLLAGMGTTLWLFDWKTGRGIYPEAVLQLSAYAHATHWLKPDGTVAEWIPPERCGAVHVTSDSATLYPIAPDTIEDAYTAFRYCQGVYGWCARVAAARDDGTPWPVEPAADPTTAGILP